MTHGQEWLDMWIGAYSGTVAHYFAMQYLEKHRTERLITGSDIKEAIDADPRDWIACKAKWRLTNGRV